jgi:DNA polymerase IV
VPRRIIHVDMDAFYASVEQRDRPELKGRPVAVGGSPESRGVVAAASYEAREFGVRSAMPMALAVRRCRDLVIVPPNFSKYRTVSQQVFGLFKSVTPLVEPLSLDEAYLDVTENAWDEPLGMNVARRIKALIRETTGLTASAGVAPNKFLAKIASAWRKPDGLTVIAPERVESFLQQLPVEALWGVGPVVGGLADWLVRLASGDDDRPVEPNRPSKSSSSECTYARDLLDIDRIRDELSSMARDNAGWLQRRGILARTVTIKVRYDDFTTITRSDTRAPTNDPDDIARRAIELLAKTDAGRRPIRLLGAGIHNLRGTDGEAADDSRLPFELDT